MGCSAPLAVFHKKQLYQRNHLELLPFWMEKNKLGKAEAYTGQMNH
jgi:hypothetical protein